MTPEDIWDDPKNADIRELRKNFDLLCPGDIIFLPEKRPEGLAIQKGGTNRYVARVPRIPIKLVLRNNGQALAQEPYFIEGLPQAEEGKTGDDGSISFEVPVNVREVHIILYEKNLDYPVMVGDLDPVEELSGVRMRLAHLGHYGWYPVYDELTAEDDRMAISSFQAAHGVDVTGVVDDALRKLLRDEHGS
jgi:hypothetical protein